MSDTPQPSSQHFNAPGNFGTMGPQNIGTVNQHFGSGSPPAASRPWCVPVSAEKFFGRKQEVQDVAALFREHTRVALIGPGGMGKTALAAEAIKHLDPEPKQPKQFTGGVFSHDYYKLPGHAFALQTILGQAGENDVPDAQRAGRVQTLLNAGGVLLYLEGCETAEDLAALLNLAAGARVLLTSRDEAKAGDAFPHDVKPLALEDARDLLHYHATSRTAFAATESTDPWAKLAERLGRHPLALRLAGTYLRGMRKQPADFLSRLDKDGFKFWNHKQGAKENLRVLFQHSAEAAKAKHPHALELWYLLALHGAALVPQAVLAQMFGNAAACEDALRALTEYSLAEAADFPAEKIGEKETAWQLAHALLLEWGFTSLPALIPDPKSLQTQWRAKSKMEFERAFAKGCVAGGPARYAALQPLWEGFLASLEKLLGLDSMLCSPEANALAIAHSSMGNYSAAEPLHRRAWAVSERTLGPEHPDTLTSMNNLAILLSDKGDLAGAEPLYRRALAARKRTLGPEHPDTLSSVNNLANLLKDKGDLVGAEPLHRRALEARERTLGPEHPDTLTSMNNLALLLADRGDLAGAEPLFRRALEAMERTLGPEHPHTLSSVNNLATLLATKCDLAGAAPLFRRALEAMERTLGPEHPDTLISVNNLANLLKAQGDLAGAEPLRRRTLEAQERTLGPEHTSTLISLHNMANLEKAKGNRAAARELWQRAVAGAEKKLGPDHPSTKQYRAALASVSGA